MHHGYNLNFLRKNINIRLFAAWFLLLLFVLGNAPKQWLHVVFADHKNIANVGLTDNGTVQIAQNGMYCQSDHFVIESAFAHPGMFISYLVPVFYGSFSSPLAGTTLNRQQYFFELRGPPVNGWIVIT